MQWLIDIISTSIMNQFTGMIMIWSGAIVDIPSGWHLCDGDNGTPDLRDKFVAGAGDTYAVGDSGGAVDHTHTFAPFSHGHSLIGTSTVQIGTDDYRILSLSTRTELAHGTNSTEDNLPPYYALAYIMKT